MPGSYYEPGQEPLVAPGVRAIMFDVPEGIYVPFVMAASQGAGDVGRWLDGLPPDRRIVFPSVLSARLRGMLQRRGYQQGTEFAPEFGEHVEIYFRSPEP
jgi:hypothetical protein